MTKILIYSTYPVVSPLHGGQKRAAAIVDKYKSLGANVTYVGIYIPAHYKHRSPQDVFIKSPEALRTVGEANGELIGDVATGYLCANNEEIYKQLIDKIIKVKPDIIQVEQAYLLPFIERAQKEGYISWQELVYSSHNIEYEMKEEMLESVRHISDSRRNEIVNQIKDMERRWAQLATITIAVTEGDAEKLRAMGATKVIVAHNGINPATFHSLAVASLRRRYERKNIKRTVLFVGSGHPPNWTGFLDTLTTGLGYIPHDTKIVVAGGVRWLMGDYVESRPVHEKICFYQRVELLGVVSEKRLGAAVELANVIILPITSGGGSNLKTAEAIASGKQVVATKFAMRGYDGFENLPGIHVASNNKEFHSMLVDALNSEKPVRNAEQKKQAEQVLWSNVLGGLEEVF